MRARVIPGITRKQYPPPRESVQLYHPDGTEVTAAEAAIGGSLPRDFDFAAFEQRVLNHLHMGFVTSSSEVSRGDADITARLRELDGVMQTFANELAEREVNRLLYGTGLSHEERILADAEKVMLLGAPIKLHVDDSVPAGNMLIVGYDLASPRGDTASVAYTNCAAITGIKVP